MRRNKHRHIRTHWLSKEETHMKPYGNRHIYTHWQESEESHYQNKSHVILTIIYFCLVLTASMLISYRLMVLLSGYLEGAVSYLVSVLLGFIIFAVLGKLVAEMLKRTRYGQELIHTRNSLYEKTLEALERISHGDFTVSVITDGHDPFNKIAESVNKMAHELSSLETQRQDFISNVSHEIQSPLTSISGFAALLKNTALTEAQRIHYLEIIETESKRLSKLSDNLLKLSNLEAENTSFSPSTFRLDKLIQNAVLMLEPQWMEKSITIDVELDQATVTGDKELLIQVWTNLLHNAIKFTPESGEIRVTLKEKDGKLICHISDNGIGIPKKDQMHIFERFYKVDKSRDRSRSGNGLGLSLVKKIIELHNGTITVQSTLGQGSVFIVLLPMEQEN